HVPGRTFADIRNLIAKSRLSDWVKQKSIAVFHRIAIAEGKVHGKSPDQVHFHEVGAVDSIVDIVGACVGLELLGKPRVLASRIVEGTGWVDCAHGRFPIPAPATLEILSARGIAITQCEEPHELVTPTGAALLAEFVESFGPMQGLAPRRIGYGLGTRNNRTRPNLVRAVLCEETGGTHDWETDTVTQLQTNLDDINAEILGRVMKRVLGEGALDVFYTPIQMKKNRPGVLLSVLCAESDADRFSEIILTETTAFGVRRHTAERRKLRREFASVETAFGRVAVKLGKLDGKVVQAAPEYESCKRAADANNVPLKVVYEAANRAIKL
ncbi:MAG: nickel pincer cofactor biosynthesis protein LarC, partial [Verrucomicrobia subdivision 3 bacterium]|nr:nickel pincer cofactor biosynthesis protein LarC [Limisphaerales bacterium]